MASTPSSSSLKRIHRSTTTIETDTSQLQDVDDEKIPKKSRLLSFEPSLDHASSSALQPQSSVTPSMLSPPPYRVELLQIIVDDEQVESGRDGSSYLSPSFIKDHKFDNSRVDDPREFFEQCLMKLQQNDPNMLSLDIDCQSIADHEITRFTDALAVNSTLLELSIRYKQLSHLVKALKLNSTLTRLSLKENWINCAAAAQLSDILRFNTTLLSLDLCNTGILPKGITQLSGALSVNTTLIHLDLRGNKMGEAATTQLCKVLTVNPMLTVLDLRDCKLKEPGVIQLSDALAGNSSLTRLEIENNPAIRWEYKERILQRLKYNRLQ